MSGELHMIQNVTGAAPARRPTQADYRRFTHMRLGCDGPLAEGRSLDGLPFLECGGCGLRRTFLPPRPSDARS